MDAHPGPAAALRARSAYDEASAARLLEAAGLTVDVRRVPGCEALGRAIGTAADRRHRRRPGAHVLLEVSDPTLPRTGSASTSEAPGSRRGRCSTSRTAAGTHPPSPTRSRSTSTRDGHVPAQASRRQRSTAGRTTRGRRAAPSLGARLDMGDRCWCPASSPWTRRCPPTSHATARSCPIAGVRDSLAVWMDYPDPALPRTASSSTCSHRRPDRRRRAADRRPGRAGRGARPGARSGRAAADAAGKAWVEFAARRRRSRGSPSRSTCCPTPTSATHAGQAADRTSWDLCPRWMSAPLRDVEPLARPRHQPRGRPDRQNPLPPGAAVPQHWRAAGGTCPSWRWSASTSRSRRSCRDTWAVQVWVDQDGAIAAVDLLLGTSPPATLTAVVPWTEDGSGHGLPGVRRGAPDVAGPGRRAARCRGDRRAARGPRRPARARPHGSSGGPTPTHSSWPHWSSGCATRRHDCPSATSPVWSYAARSPPWTPTGERWRSSPSTPT